MTEVEAETIKAFGFRKDQLRNKPIPDRQRVPCGICGHSVVMSDGRAIHSPHGLCSTHRCWIVVPGRLSMETFCGCERAEWGD